MKKMKWLCLLIASVLFLGLAGCSTEKEVENPKNEIVQALGLGNETLSLNPNVDTSKDYIDVKINANYSDTLFVFSYDFDKNFKDNQDKILELHIRALTFVTDISKENQELILNEVYNETYGISKLELGITNNVKASKSFGYKLENGEALIKAGYKLYTDNVASADEKEGPNVCLSIAFLPSKVVVVKDGQKVVDNYLMIPVYVNFNIANEKTQVFGDSTFIGLNVLESKYVNASNYLLNKTAEDMKNE